MIFRNKSSRDSRKERRARERAIRSWSNKSQENWVSWQFDRLAELQKRFPKGKLRVADCPVTGKPILQGFMFPSPESSEKQWHCIHEDKTLHCLSDYPDFVPKIYEKESNDA